MLPAEVVVVEPGAAVLPGADVVAGDPLQANKHANSYLSASFREQ